MSSHHFVKEGQEPALIIANGESCSYTLLTSLLEWCPYIVVLDGAYKRVEALQIKPDAIVGDFDSLDKIPEELNIEIVKIDDQNTTDLEKGRDDAVHAYAVPTVVGRHCDGEADHRSLGHGIGQR